MPSDPQKVSRIRAINRAFAALDNDTDGGVVAALAGDAVLRNATRFALKLTEHTCVRQPTYELPGSRATEPLKARVGAGGART